jgi:hypothetical protein
VVDIKPTTSSDMVQKEGKSGLVNQRNNIPVSELYPNL